MALKHSASGSITSVLPLDTELRTAITHTILKAPQLELIHAVLLAGKEVHEHRTPGEMTVQCIEGCFELCTHNTVLKLVPGDLVHLLSNESHALKAIQDSSFLITIRLNSNG